jgi:hypothetical protein
MFLWTEGVPYLGNLAGRAGQAEGRLTSALLKHHHQSQTFVTRKEFTKSAKQLSLKALFFSFSKFLPVLDFLLRACLMGEKVWVRLL